MQKALKEAALHAKDSIRLDSIKNSALIIRDTVPQLLKDSTKILVK